MLRRVIQSFALILPLLVACARPTLPSLPPGEIVTRAAARMTAMRGFHFVIERTGALAYLDYEGTLAFSRAEGEFVTPDTAQAAVRVIAPGLVAEVQILGIGERYWQTNLLTGQWEEFPPGVGFNPAMMFDPQIGLQPIIAADLTDLKLTGVEELEEYPGKQLYSITGQMTGERLYQMSYQMIGPEAVTVHLWVAPETFELYRVQLTEPAPGSDEPTVWQVDFWSFDQPATITPPTPAGP
jgi:lipoprotein LprG